MPIACMFSTQGEIDADEAVVLDQDLDASSRSPLSLRRKRAVALPAGLGEQLRRLRRAACGRGPSRRRPAAAPPRRTLRPGSCREAARAAPVPPARAGPRPVVRPLEERLRALVGAVEQVALRPFEIEAERDRLAHARVAEALAPLVDRHRLHGRPLLAGKFALDDLAGRRAPESRSRSPRSREVNSWR